MSGRWWEQAACAGLPEAMFFPPREPGCYDQARAVCATCPVQGPCLADARTAMVDTGFVGGTSPMDRKALPGPGRGRSRRGLDPANGCGTSAGYARHRRAGEPACAACKRGHAHDTAERKRAVAGVRW